MKMIEKEQKPKDMIVFLKSNKSKIELFNYKNIFKYELKDLEKRLKELGESLWHSSKEARTIGIRRAD